MVGWWVVDIESVSAWCSGSGGQECLDGCPVKGSNDLEQEPVFVVGDE